MTKNLFKNIKGETLAETIVALSVLAIGITVASSSIISSLRNMAIAKNSIVAVNLAREGIEAMHNIRDTNWLMYSDRRRECWNHDPYISPCDGTAPIPPGRYVVYQAEDHHWKLILADNDPTADTNEDQILDNDLDLAPLSQVDIDLTLDSNGDEDLTNDIDIYNHITGIKDPYGKEVLKTPFLRYITLEYLDNDGSLKGISQLNEPFDSINTAEEWKSLQPTEIEQLNRLRVTSTVERTQGGVHKAELKTILTDHLGRTELQS